MNRVYLGNRGGVDDFQNENVIRVFLLPPALQKMLDSATAERLIAQTNGLVTKVTFTIEGSGTPLVIAGATAPRHVDAVVTVWGPNDEILWTLPLELGQTGSDGICTLSAQDLRRKAEQLNEMTAHTGNSCLMMVNGQGAENSDFNVQKLLLDCVDLMRISCGDLVMVHKITMGSNVNEVIEAMIREDTITISDREQHTDPPRTSVNWDQLDSTGQLNADQYKTWFLHMVDTIGFEILFEEDDATSSQKQIEADMQSTIETLCFECFDRQINTYSGDDRTTMINAVQSWTAHVREVMVPTVQAVMSWMKKTIVKVVNVAEVAMDDLRQEHGVPFFTAFYIVTVSDRHTPTTFLPSGGRTIPSILREIMANHDADTNSASLVYRAWVHYVLLHEMVRNSPIKKVPKTAKALLKTLNKFHANLDTTYINKTTLKHAMKVGKAMERHGWPLCLLPYFKNTIAGHNTGSWVWFDRLFVVQHQKKTLWEMLVPIWKKKYNIELLDMFAEPSLTLNVIPNDTSIRTDMDDMEHHEPTLVGITDERGVDVKGVYCERTTVILNMHAPGFKSQDFQVKGVELEHVEVSGSEVTVTVITNYAQRNTIGRQHTHDFTLSYDLLEDDDNLSHNAGGEEEVEVDVGEQEEEDTYPGNVRLVIRFDQEVEEEHRPVVLGTRTFEEGIAALRDSDTVGPLTENSVIYAGMTRGKEVEQVDATHYVGTLVPVGHDVQGRKGRKPKIYIWVAPFTSPKRKRREHSSSSSSSTLVRETSKKKKTTANASSVAKKKQNNASPGSY